MVEAQIDDESSLLLERSADIADALMHKNWPKLRDAVKDLHPSDIADLIIALPTQHEGILFRVLPRDLATRVFAYLPAEYQEELLASLSGPQVEEIINNLSDDDRTRLFEALPAEVTRGLLNRLSPEELQSARELLGYPPNTAGRYMTPHYVSLRPDMTAGEALEHVRLTGRHQETLHVVYIVDADGRLIEDLRLGSLVLAAPLTPVMSIHDPALVWLPAMAGREEVLRAFEKYDRVALPVVDEDHKMLGIITVDDVLDIAERESTIDMQKLGGSEALDAPYLNVGFWSMVRKRGGWLSALFLGEMLTATAMSYFETEIARAVVLALFVPLIISSGGNSGSQATSLIIRGLAVRDLALRDWFRVFQREILSGIALGSLLGFIGFLRIVLWQHLHFANYGSHYMLVAFTVWASLVGVVAFGSTSGSMLPFLLRKLGFDPATSSAPFVATLVDVTGLVIYFTIAAIFLHGTLL
jgi:magnesium transporter